MSEDVTPPRREQHRGGPQSHVPTPQDRLKPMNRAGLREANRRFRKSGLDGYSDAETVRGLASDVIKHVRGVERTNPQFRAETVADYLTNLNDAASAVKEKVGPWRPPVPSTQDPNC